MIGLDLINISSSEISNYSKCRKTGCSKTGFPGVRFSDTFGWSRLLLVLSVCINMKRSRQGLNVQNQDCLKIRHIPAVQNTDLSGFQTFAEYYGCDYDLIKRLNASKIMHCLINRKSDHQSWFINPSKARFTDTVDVRKPNFNTKLDHFSYKTV